MLLMNNELFLRGKENKHIYVWYFFITDQMNKRESKMVVVSYRELIAIFPPSYCREHSSTNSEVSFLESKQRISGNIK